VRKFLFAITDCRDDNHFLKHFLPFQKKISDLGMWNSLSSLALKLGAPGVCDTYQGTELWDYSLVDPDNRRRVDFSHRHRMLKSIRRKAEAKGGVPKDWLRELVGSREDGRIKMYLLWKLLHLRRENSDLFLNGDYMLLRVQGPRERNLVAYLRRREGKIACVIAGRFFSEWPEEQSGDEAREAFWKGTTVALPQDFAGSSLRDVLSETDVKVENAGDGKLLKVGSVPTFMKSAVLINF